MERYHDAATAREAEADFDRVHVRGELPEEIDEVAWGADDGTVHLPALLARAFGVSKPKRGAGWPRARCGSMARSSGPPCSMSRRRF